VDACITDLGRCCAYPHPLAACLQQFTAEIGALRPGETLDRRLADYFYQFVAREPFASWLKNDNRARNLATFSQLLNVFQSYYHYTVITDTP
jgi:DNA helicase-2/ATP-dependent DNA helicase PcrA